MKRDDRCCGGGVENDLFLRYFSFFFFPLFPFFPPLSLWRACKIHPYAYTYTHVLIFVLYLRARRKCQRQRYKRGRRGWAKKSSLLRRSRPQLDPLSPPVPPPPRRQDYTPLELLIPAAMAVAFGVVQRGFKSVEKKKFHRKADNDDDDDGLKRNVWTEKNTHSHTYGDLVTREGPGENNLSCLPAASFESWEAALKPTGTFAGRSEKAVQMQRKGFWPSRRNKRRVLTI